MGNKFTDSDDTPFDVAHFKSDVDMDKDSLHHTLGSGPTQAASGSLVQRLQNLIAELTRRETVKSVDVLPADFYIYVSPAAGWSINEFEFARVGDFVYLYVSLKRTGVAIASAADGNLVNEDLFQLGTRWLPEAFSFLVPSSMGRSYSGQLFRAGNGRISAGPPGYGVDTNDNLTFNSNYPCRADLNG